MRRVFLVLLIFSAGLLALGALGCGGSESTADTTSSNSEVSKAAFVKQANAICGRTNRELAQLSERFSKENNLSEKIQPTEAQVTELSQQALVPIAKQVEEIRALEAPAGEEDEVDAIVTAAEKALEEGEADPAAIYGAGGGAFAQANRLSAAYGLKECSE